jgi:predicted lipoprotein with Yx(FWY)xxD motif
MSFANRTATLLTLSAALLGGCASMTPMAAAPAKAVDGVLVGANGMTLYTFDRDVTGSGKSVCNGPCATNWPPLKAADSDAATGDYTVVVRDDGSKQWAAKGKPLYFWVKDVKVGDKTGDGVLTVWHTAKP